MATIQERPFSKNYSGLINQSVIAGCIVVIAITSHELMKRRRRGNPGNEDKPGSVESWEFGYLYQGRSWARKPSPLHSRGWPLTWVKEVIKFPEERINELRGVDATLYIRFLRGCFWFTLLHTLTTLPILLPIHVTFAGDSVPPKSMTRASITSLVLTEKGLSLLWIHLLLIIWITLTWLYLLVWLCRGAFRLRAQNIVATADRMASAGESINPYDHPHPHPQYPFHVHPSLESDTRTRGIRMRTVMVTNVPPLLRSEKDLKEYFEYYLSRPVAKPAIGVTSTTPPGFLNKSFAFLLNQLSRIPAHLRHPRISGRSVSDVAETSAEFGTSAFSTPERSDTSPSVERVILVRRMTELASLLERREEVLRLLETAHIKLARRAAASVKQTITLESKSNEDADSPTSEGRTDEGGENRMQLLVRTLRPYLVLPNAQEEAPLPLWTRWTQWLHPWDSTADKQPISVHSETGKPTDTIWEALLSLPRSTLDAYQPLIHLSALFRGRAVPAIDYYTAKLDILTSLITEKRAKAANGYESMSTAFITFADPADARKACKFLAVHPANPLHCFVTMAPAYEDLDWIRLMKPTFRVEFVKDWLVNLGVWGFTVFWVFPVSIFVGLVSIQNISTFLPGLDNYLNKHPWEEEVLQSFVPTLLVSLLSLLIPLILLLIAKKAHTIATLSAMHDRIMTRYYKFLVVNVLVFFCVGTAALQSFLVSFKATSGLKVIQVVADSFPTAGPFYVGWLIFTTAIHGGFELALFGLPLILYPSTKRQITPRKRAIGIRPRTFNYYYWLPNHVLVIHVLVVFAVLNPLVIPFGFLYYCVELVVIKNQLIHVYAKNYENHGRTLTIRIIRYSCDGLMLAQVVFLAYMVVLKKQANVAVSAVLVALTAIVKLLLTRLCRARFERDDMLEAEIICGTGIAPEALLDEAQPIEKTPTEMDPVKLLSPHHNTTRTLPARGPWGLPTRIDDGYATIPRRPHDRMQRGPNPFASQDPECAAEEILPEKTMALTISTIPLPRDRSEDNQSSHSRPNRASAPSASVTPHVAHPAWDDESCPDRPYENPYYARAIHEELWLPRDPLGLLNLDDTVNLRLSLTTQPGSGRLGAWREDEFLASGLSTFMGSVDRNRAASVDGAPTRRLLGVEQIDLPSSILSRLESVDADLDTELEPPHPRRSIASGRRHASLGGRPASLEFGLGHPGNVATNRASGWRSFSMNVPHSRRLNSSFFTVTSGDRQLRSVSLDSSRESRHLRSMSTTAIPLGQVVPERCSSPETTGAEGIVSLREAVVEEAIVEEEVAAQERLLQEEAEEEQAEEHRSWWTSWMFYGRR